MSYSALRTAAETALNTVSDIGVVFDRLRVFTTKTELETNCDATIDEVRQIRFWTVTCGPLAREDAYFGNNIDKTYNLIIRGYLGLDDSADTELTLITLAESVMDALDANTTLNDMDGGGPYESERAQMPQGHQVVEYGGVLCNHVEIVKQVVDRAGKH